MKKTSLIFLGIMFIVGAMAVADTTTSTSTSIAVQSWVTSQIQTLTSNGTIGLNGSTVTASGQRGSGPSSVTMMDVTGSNGRIFVDGPSTSSFLGFQVILCDSANTCTYTPIASDATGNVTVNSGSQTLLRCTTAGTLPVGALTVAAGNCGASLDTGLRVK